MLCRVLLGAIAISYLICVLVLSFMQKEDLDVGLLRRVQRSNADSIEITTETARRDCFSRRSVDKKNSNGPSEDINTKTATKLLSTQLEKQHEISAKELAYALEKLDLASIVECLKHIQVTVTPSTVTAPTRKPVTPLKPYVAITKDYSFTNKPKQFNFSADSRLKNMFKLWETTTKMDIATHPMFTTAKKYTVNRKAGWNVDATTMRTKRQRTFTPQSVARNKLKVIEPSTISDDVDSKEIERMSKILTQYKNRKKHVPKRKIITVKRTTMEPTTVESTTTSDSTEIEHLGKMLAQYGKRQEHLKKTTTKKPTRMKLTTSDSTELEHLDQMLAQYEKRQEQLTITTTKKPTTMKLTTSDSTELEHLDRMLAQYEKRQEQLTKTTTKKPTTMKLTTSDSTELEHLDRMLAQYEKRQEQLTKTTTKKPTTMKLTTSDSTEIEHLNELLAEYEMRQEQVKKTTIRTTTQKPKIMALTRTSDSREMEHLNELLAKYEMRQEQLKKTTITTVEPTTIESKTSSSNEIEHFRKILVQYENRQEQLKKTTAKFKPTTMELTIATSDSREVENLNKLLVEYENRREQPKTTTTVKPTTTKDASEMEHLNVLLAEYKKRQEQLRKTITTTVKPTTIIELTTTDDSDEIEKISKILNQFKNLKKIITTVPTTMQPTTIDNFREIERLSKLLAEYENRKNHLQKTTTTVAPTSTSVPITTNESREIERLSKLLAEYENRQHLKKTITTTVTPTTVLRIYEDAEQPREEATTKDSVILTDPRLRDMLNFWDNFIKTSTPFELKYQTAPTVAITTTTPKTITTKTTTIGIKNVFKNFNWYVSRINSAEHTTDTEKVTPTTHAIESLYEDTKGIKRFSELMNEFKIQRKMHHIEEPFKPKPKKFINNAVKRIEHYLKMIKAREDAGSDIENDYKDTTDIEVDDNKTYEIETRKTYFNNYNLKNRRNKIYETTTNIEKDFKNNVFKPTTPRKKEIEELKDLPPAVLRDIAKNIKEQILNDLRKEITTEMSTEKTTIFTTAKKRIYPTPPGKKIPVIMPSRTAEHASGDEKQEATKAIVKFIKIIEQFTFQKETNLSLAPSSIKTLAPDKTNSYPAPINILYQHTNLLPPLKMPDLLVSPYNKHQKRVINSYTEHSVGSIDMINSYNDYKPTVKPHENPVILQTFPGHIPPLHVPQALFSEQIIVKKNTALTTQPQEVYDSNSHDPYELYYQRNNKRGDIKKIKDNLGEYADPRKVKESHMKEIEIMKTRSDAEEKPTTYRYDINDKYQKRNQEPYKEDDFRKYNHNGPNENNPKLPFKEPKFRKFIHEKYQSSPQPYRDPEFVNEDKSGINLHGDIQNIKGFHERFEGFDQWPKDPNTLIDNLKQEESRASALEMTSRQQLPLSHMKKIYDDSPFRNFIKTQQKVNEMLEDILASRAKARSIETT